MKFNVVRAWKDAEYRQSLSEQEQAQLPESPVGAVDLSEADLDTVYGAHCHHHHHSSSSSSNGGGNSSSTMTSINSLAAAACTNSTAAVGFCISFGVGCGL